MKRIIQFFKNLLKKKFTNAIIVWGIDNSVELKSTDTLEQSIVKLRKVGYTYKKISEISGLTLSQVKSKIHKLIKEGKLERKTLRK